MEYKHLTKIGDKYIRTKSIDLTEQEKMIFKFLNMSSEPMSLRSIAYIMNLSISRMRDVLHGKNNKIGLLQKEIGVAHRYEILENGGRRSLYSLDKGYDIFVSDDAAKLIPKKKE